MRKQRPQYSSGRWYHRLLLDFRQGPLPHRQMHFLPSISFTLLILGGCFLLGNAVLFVAFRRPLLALWREPALRVPVVIFESDDWGAGPAEQAPALQRLRTLLARHTDARGRHPVMTLGLTLAAPEVHAAGAGLVYSRRLLGDAEHVQILGEIRHGIGDGVFAAQLHGMEHFMPSVVCDVALRDASVRDWLLRGDRYSELLPDHLQSRWIDARRLPSVEHADALVESAIAEEVATFARLFGHAPRVVVPTTFVWTRRVEQAWARQGLRFLVTCGKRFVGRDAAGKLLDDGATLRNGEASSDMVCLVRDAYFEPARGHRAQDAVPLLRQYADCARPLLYETHRFNFTSLNPAAEQAFTEFSALLAALLERFPRLRFLSTEELGDAIALRDPTLIDESLGARLRAWLQRAGRLQPFRRYARLSGASLLISLLLLAFPPPSD